jgi:hypothetical protein
MQWESGRELSRPFVKKRGEQEQSMTDQQLQLCKIIEWYQTPLRHKTEKETLRTQQPRITVVSRRLY